MRNNQTKRSQRENREKEEREAGLREREVSSYPNKKLNTNARDALIKTSLSY